MSRRIVSCLLLDGRREAMPPMDPAEGPKTPKWATRWEFGRNGKQVRIAVEVYAQDGAEREVIDARQFIERLAEFPAGTGFDIYVEAKDAG